MPSTTNKKKNGDGTVTVTKRSKRKYARKNMGALEFINNVLATSAVSSITGASDYKGWTTEENGKTTVNFASSAYQAKLDITQNYMFEVGNASGKSNVISFTPSYTIVPDSFDSEEIVETALLDKFTNEMYQFSYTSKGAFKNLNEATLENTSTNTVKYFASSSYTNQELERMAATLWLKQNKLAVKATLSILGDPHIKPMTNISIICIMPSGLPHITSGVYLITAVSHEIKGGLFTTNLEVLRNELEVSIDENGNIQFEVGAANDVDTGEDDSDSSQESSNSGGSNGNSNSGNTATVTGKRSELVNEARKHIGKPYVWGARGPDTFDCSGLVWYCMKTLGKVSTNGDWTGSMIGNEEYGKEITGTIADLPPGCIVFCNNNQHVVITSGNGNVIHAPQPGENVCEVNGSWVSGIVKIRDPYAK